MSSTNTPGLQVRSRRDNARTARPQRPSGPGVRWRLAPDVTVRFSPDMTRVHTDAKGHRNLVQLRYRTSMRDRPSDMVLALLLSAFITAPADRPVGNRCWILQQTEQGWALALDVRNGHGCCFVLPGVDDQGKSLGVPLDLGNPRDIAGTVHTLWQAADQRIAHPDQVPEVMLTALSR